MKAIVPCLLLLAMTGRSPGSPDPGTLPSADVVRSIKTIRTLINETNFDEALRFATSLDGWARQNPGSSWAAFVPLYRGICLQRTFQFPEAIAAYVQARETALASGNRIVASTASHNLSNLHLQAGATKAALAAAEDALRSFPPGGPRDHLLQIQIHHARLLARDGHFDEFERRLRELLLSATFSNKRTQEAWVWEALGNEALFRGDTAEAGDAFSRAYRIRLLARDPDAASTLWRLGEVRLATGDPAGALRLFEAASAGSRNLEGSLAAWRRNALRARALLAAGDRERALDLFRRAAADVEESRIGLLPADLLRVDAGEAVNIVFDGYVEALLASGSADLNELSRALVGRRAASLRADPVWVNHIRQSLPPAYWAALNRLQALQVRAYRARAAIPELSRLRGEMAAMEAAAGAAGALGATPKRPLELADLSASEAVLVFHSAGPSRFLLAGSRKGWTLTRLPPGEELPRLLRQFDAAVAEGNPSAAELGEGAYRALFGKLPADIAGRRSWILLLADSLFRTPFAAMVVSKDGGRPRYLVEDHALKVAPGLWTRDRVNPAGPAGLSFLGVGDPIYNAADPRRKAMDLTMPGVELPRLAGSGREVQSCAALFGRNQVLTGEAASLARLASALAEPDVIHIASHALPAPDSPAETLLALSLGPMGAPELLSPEWISSRRVRARVVVMNGCRSGGGETRPGEGLMGLTRAWLYAGAGSVVATYWPTVDDSGEIIAEFYRNWRRSDFAASSPEEALRQAQISMISLGGWRANPRYWGAYFLSSAGSEPANAGVVRSGGSPIKSGSKPVAIAR
ncbi:MAG: CHAT domain-containing tetratricopeptide repeat protein [Bryobacteraceae bacterium]